MLSRIFDSGDPDFCENIFVPFTKVNSCEEKMISFLPTYTVSKKVCRWSFIGHKDAKMF